MPPLTTFCLAWLLPVVFKAAMVWSLPLTSKVPTLVVLLSPRVTTVVIGRTLTEPSGWKALLSSRSLPFLMKVPPV